MKLKILSLFAGASLMSLSGIGIAKEVSQDVVLAQIELSRKIGQDQTRDVIASSMKLNEAEDEIFWPVYDSYMADIQVINDRLLVLITEYADYYNSEGASELQASNLTDEYLDIEGDRINVKKKFLKRFKKVLPDQKVMLFFQVDNRLQNLVNLGLISKIPLIIE